MNSNNRTGIRTGTGKGHDGRNGDRHVGRRRPTFDPEIARVRLLEYRRRSAGAQGRAEIRLRELYPEDWARLYKEEKIKVWEERGPLPGDDQP